MVMISRFLRATSIWLVIAACLAVGPADAQIFTPSFLAPQRASDVGVYLSDGPGEFGIEGIWRRGFGQGYDLGFRAGVASTDDVSVLLGADYRHPIAAGAPVGIAATGSVQGVLGEFSGAGVTAGLSIGPRISSGGLSFTPYLHPRVGLVRGLRSADTFLELLADLGFDLTISPGLDLRFGVGLDSFGADWGVGLAWR